MHRIGGAEMKWTFVFNWINGEKQPYIARLCFAMFCVSSWDASFAGYDYLSS